MWPQPLDPLGHPALSALAAALPIVFLFWALAVRRMRGHVAGLSTTGLAVLVAVVAFGMPVRAGPSGNPPRRALWPVPHRLDRRRRRVPLPDDRRDRPVRDHQAVDRRHYGDRRIQALLIAFSFGAFLEGAAGFGTPVAISAAMLVGLGFEPITAAGLCLLANTAPVAFGAIGTPIVVAGQVDRDRRHVIAQMVGRQLPFLSVRSPAGSS